MKALDVSGLPDVSFDRRSLLWWGTLGFMAVEGTSLALCGATFFYLQKNFETWPPAGFLPLPLFWSTVTLALLLLSVIPAWLASRAARRHDRRATARFDLWSLGVDTLALAARALEIAALNVRWDTNAYGSIVWFTIGIHTTLLLFDWFESAALTWLFIAGPVQPKHYPDATDASFYRYFVVGIWVLGYVVVYLTPRL